MSLSLESENSGYSSREWVTEGTPTDLGINFLGGAGLKAPENLNKWSMQLIQTGVFINGIEFDIKYDTAGTVVTGCEFLLPADWHQYIPESNIPDEGDSIVSLPTAGIVMTSDTDFVPAIAYVQKIGTNYWIRLVGTTPVPAKGFMGGVRFTAKKTYVQGL